MHITSLRGEHQHCTIVLIGLAFLFLAGCTAVAAQADTAMNRPVAGVTPASTRNQAPSRQQQLQTLFDAAVLDKSVYHRDDEILVRWPEEMAGSAEITLRIQKADGRIYGERQALVEAGAVINLGHAYVLRDGPYNVVLMPPIMEYYVGGLRVDRKIGIDVRVQQP